MNNKLMENNSTSKKIKGTTTKKPVDRFMLSIKIRMGICLVLIVVICALTFFSNNNVSTIEIDGNTFKKTTKIEDFDKVSKLLNEDYNSTKITHYNIFNNSIYCYSISNSNGDVIEKDDNVYSIYSDSGRYKFTDTSIEECESVSIYSILYNIRAMLNNGQIYKNKDNSYIIATDYNKDIIKIIYNNGIEDNYEDEAYNNINSILNIDESTAKRNDTKIVALFEKDEFNEDKYIISVEIIYNNKVKRLVGVSSAEYCEDNFDISDIKEIISDKSDSLALNSFITTINNIMGK